MRKVQVEGESGILACSPPWDRPIYRSSSTIQTLEWKNGAVAHLLTAEKPDKIRGYNFDAAWLDELAAWEANNFQDTIDQLIFALRKGTHPRVCVTTTPKPHLPFVKFFNEMKDHEENGKAVIVTGNTFANAANLAPAALENLKNVYFDDEGNPTQLAKQELFGYVIEDFDKRLWTEETLESEKIRFAFEKFDYKKELERIVISVDPSGAKTGDETGIIVFGIRKEDVTVFDKNKKQHVIKKLPVGYLLEDASGQYSPNEWGEKSCMLYHRYQADCIIGERNYGGDLVKENILQYDPKVPFVAATATRGKEIRAMPVASLYEAFRIKHWIYDQYEGKVNRNKYHALKQQMLNMTFSGYIGDNSPDRLDALVWAVNNTMLKGMSESGSTDIFFGKGGLSGNSGKRTFGFR